MEDLKPFCTHSQFSISSQIISSLAEVDSTTHPLFLSKIEDENVTCVVLQWISLSLSCIVDSTNNIEIIHSSIPEGPFSIHFQSSEIAFVSEILTSFFINGPRLFHNVLYEQIMHDRILLLNKIREHLEHTRSLLFVIQRTKDSFKSMISEKRKLILAFGYLSQISVLDIGNCSNSLTKTKNHPLSHFLLPSANSLLDIIYNQTLPLKQNLEAATSQLSQLSQIRNGVQIVASINNISQQIEQLSVQEFDSLYQKFQILLVDSLASVIQTLKFVEECTTSILEFDLTKPDKNQNKSFVCLIN